MKRFILINFLFLVSLFCSSCSLSGNGAGADPVENVNGSSTPVGSVGDSPTPVGSVSGGPTKQATETQVSPPPNPVESSNKQPTVPQVASPESWPMFSIACSNKKPCALTDMNKGLSLEAKKIPNKVDTYKVTPYWQSKKDGPIYFERKQDTLSLKKDNNGNTYSFILSTPDANWNPDTKVHRITIETNASNQKFKLNKFKITLFCGTSKKYPIRSSDNKEAKWSIEHGQERLTLSEQGKCPATATQSSIPKERIRVKITISIGNSVSLPIDTQLPLVKKATEADPCVIVLYEGKEIRVCPPITMVNLTKKKVSIVVPLPPIEGRDAPETTAVPNWFTCIPGIRYNGQSYWLSRDSENKNTWIFPDTPELQNILPTALLDVISKAASGKDKRPCGDNSEVLSQITAANIAKNSTLRVPITRPVLVYILRNQTGDIGIGANNANLFWNDLLMLLETNLSNRMYIVRYKPDPNGFQSIYAPNASFAAPNFDTKEIMTRSDAVRSSPSLDKVASDALTVIKDFGRDSALKTADVIILGPTLNQNCEIHANQFTSLNSGKKSLNRMLLLAVSEGPQLDDATNRYNSVAATCSLQHDDRIDIRFTDVKESASRKRDLFPQTDWKDALLHTLAK